MKIGLIISSVFFTCTNFAFADLPRYHLSTAPQPAQLILAQTHAGQMDTDGILSQGELRNPNIDYDKAQRRAERHDDQRFDNPYNEDAADDARDDKRYNEDRQYREWYDRRNERRTR